MLSRYLSPYLLAYLLVIPQTICAQPIIERTFTQWKKTCLSYEKALSEHPKTFLPSPLSKDEFNTAQDAFNDVLTNQLITSKKWVNPPLDHPKAIINYSFNPYVQKCLLLPGATVTLLGDIHGDIVPLMTTLDILKKRGLFSEAFELKNSHYLIFLGDYTDRGPCCIEVMYTLFRLKSANPENVYLLRGNHEDMSINEYSGTFGKELKNKLNLTCVAERQQYIYNLYELLPIALYIGTPNNDYVALCHGGLEIGFEPAPLLNAHSTKTFMYLGTLNRTKALASLQTQNNDLKLFLDTSQDNCDNIVPKTPRELHFLWNDFHDKLETSSNFHRGTGWNYGELLTTAVLKRDTIHALIRGHNHKTTFKDRGVHCSYNGLVTTLISVRKIKHTTFFKRYSFITMHIDASFADWEVWHEYDNLVSPIKRAGQHA